MSNKILMQHNRKYRLEKIQEVKWNMFWNKYGYTIAVVALILGTILLLMFVTPVASHSHWL